MKESLNQTQGRIDAIADPSVPSLRHLGLLQASCQRISTLLASGRRPEEEIQTLLGEIRFRAEFLHLQAFKEGKVVGQVLQ